MLLFLSICFLLNISYFAADRFSSIMLLKASLGVKSLSSIVLLLIVFSIFAALFLVLQAISII